MPEISEILFTAGALFIGFFLGVWYKALQLKRERMEQQWRWTSRLRLVENER